MTDIKEKYIACMVLHAVGDSIGFKNGEWEFNYFSTIKTFSFVYELLNDFIDIGGINHIDLKDWRVSDDTIMHMALANGLLESKNKKIDNMMKRITYEFMSALKQLLDETDIRYPGKTIIENLYRIYEGLNWNEIEYNFMYGGSGASMRTSCIGLAFNGKQNRDALIELAIESSRITHNSVIGYLGGLTSALFTAFAIEGIPLNRWAFELIDLLTNQSVRNYIKSSGRGLAEYDRDEHIFLNKWKRYVEDKFDDNGNIIKRKSSKNLQWRGEYYTNNYSIQSSELMDSPETIFPGKAGDDSVIIAYDCLLDADKKWEKFVIYSMLHIGDTDTTGCIGASWWGALYGFMDVPPINYEYLEYKKEIFSLGDKLYKKFYKL